MVALVVWKFVPPCTSYIPPFQPGIWMKTSFSELIKQASDLQDPILESFYWLTRLPYLQAFIDGNKLTSRMAANIPQQF